jgi:ubiquinone/menaquinone biosynthesis C-methylase UbiE
MSQQPNPAQAYEDYLVTHMFRPFARELVSRADPRPGERVLDVACGTGVVARLVAPLIGPTGSGTGLDASAAMLAVARERAGAEGIDMCWREGNAMALPFDDASFDLVLCHQGLQFFPDRIAAVREMGRVLAPNGRVLVSSWSPIATNPLMRAFDDAAIRHLGFSPAAIPFGLGGADALEAIMRAAGFTEVEVTPVELTLRWPSYGEYIRVGGLGASAAVPAFAALSQDERDTLVRALEEEVRPRIAEYLDGEAVAHPQQTDIAMARR